MTAAAKLQRRFHANVLLFVLIASLEIFSEGLPLSSTLFYSDLPYHRATSSAGNEGPAVYRANELRGLLDGLNPEDESSPFQSDEDYSTENGNVARRLLGGRKLHGNIIIFSSGRPEFNAREQIDRNQLGRLYYAHSKTPYSFREMDAGFSLYSAAEDGNTGRTRTSSRLDQQDGMLDDLLFTHPSNDDESAWEDDRGMITGSKTKRVFFRSKSSSSSLNRGESSAIRNEGAVHPHPVYLGYGQETAASALSTLARLLADRQMNPIEGRTRESIRFIG